MQRVFDRALALAFLLSLAPACGQSAGSTSQLVQEAQPPTPASPTLASPAPVAASQPPWQPPPEPTVPEDVIGLCQCVYSQQLPKGTYDLARLHLSCISGAGQCKSSCGNSVYYSFVPAASHSCPGQPGEAIGRVASNTQ